MLFTQIANALSFITEDHVIGKWQSPEIDEIYSFFAPVDVYEQNW